MKHQPQEGQPLNGNQPAGDQPKGNWLSRSVATVMQVTEHALTDGNMMMPGNVQLGHGTLSAETEAAHTFGDTVQGALMYADRQGAHFEQSADGKMLTTGLLSQDGQSVIVLSGPAKPAMDANGISRRTESVEIRHRGEGVDAYEVLEDGTWRPNTDHDREKFSQMLKVKPRVVSEIITPHSTTNEGETIMRREVYIVSSAPDFNAKYKALGEAPGVTFVAPLDEASIEQFQATLKDSEPVLSRKDVKKFDKKHESPIKVTVEQKFFLDDVVPEDMMEMVTPQVQSRLRLGREAVAAADRSRGRNRSINKQPVGRSVFLDATAEDLFADPTEGDTISAARLSGAERSIRRALGQS